MEAGKSNKESHKRHNTSGKDKIDERLSHSQENSQKLLTFIKF